jgi:branched-chain amino acid transport system permease protein
MVGIYGILALSLNLSAGLAGLISIAHAAFFGVGAYASAWLMVHHGAPFYGATLFASLVTLVLATLVAVCTARARGEHFILATFAFQVIFSNTITNASSVTGGPMGISAIPRPHPFGLPIQSNAAFLMVVLPMLVLTAGMALAVSRSSIGRVLRAIREDEIFVESVGHDVRRYRMGVFVLSAIPAAAAGALYAAYMGFIDPSSFGMFESILILSMVIVGGAGSSGGALVGTALLIAIPEALRFVGLPAGPAANLRQILYGSALVLCMGCRPQGLFGEYSYREPQP